MKKTLLFILLPLIGFSQNLFNSGFTGVTADLTTAGWTRTNQSTSASTTALWSIASYTQVTVNSLTSVQPTPFQNQVYTDGQVCPIPNGQDGTPNTFALVNFASTSSTAPSGATISNWLITPTITVQNGDVVSFYSRKGTSGNTDYRDRLELRMSSNSTTTVPSTGPTDVGSFSTLCLSVNPNLLNGFVYPKVWTQYTYTVSGLSSPTAVKFAFRYFVTDGGQNGANSDIIGIDTFTVDRPTASLDDFFSNNFSFINPVNDVLSISSKNNLDILSYSILDVNGRTINYNSSDLNNINVSNLSSGVYFISIQTNEGKGIGKFIKK
jgi:hypothetical protein